MIKKPKPCPFCGNDPDDWPIRLFSPDDNKLFAVWCSTCEFSGPNGQTRELAIKAWNVRAETK